MADDARSCIVLDFETTGLSPNQGDRAIEIGAVKLEGGEVVDRFQELMHPGRRISRFIEDYTGITNAMLAEADPGEAVMTRFADWCGGADLVAHNASFDRRFLEAELAHLGRRPGRFACSMLLARRLVPEAPCHGLGALVEHLGIPNDGTFHRALADAEMTVGLWRILLARLQDEHGLTTVSFTDLQRLARTPKAQVGRFLGRLAGL